MCIYIYIYIYIYTGVLTVAWADLDGYFGGFLHLAQPAES